MSATFASCARARGRAIRRDGRRSCQLHDGRRIARRLRRSGADGLDVGVHIHAAEDPVDERITRERFGCGLIERFERVGLLDVPGTILGHGTHLSDADIAARQRTRRAISLAHNPSSNMNNGVGYTPVAKSARPPQLGHRRHRGRHVARGPRRRIQEPRCRPAAAVRRVAGDARPIGPVRVEMPGREARRAGSLVPPPTWC